MNTRILIVDDNPKNLQVLGNILKNDEYTIEFALDGKAAIDWLNEDSFDLILLDVMMPNMDGFQACKYIRTVIKDNETPIIFLTAKNDRESIVRGFDIGGQDYISKPFDSKELLVRIRTQIELKKNREALKALNLELEDKVRERTIELKEANNSLQESEATYRYALEASKDGIWDWDLETDTVKYSVGVYKMLGYEYNEFPQKRSEIHKRTHPDDLQGRDKADYIQQLRQNKQPFNKYKFRVKTKSGDYKWLEVKGQAVKWNKEKNISRIVGTHTDISSQKAENYKILSAILKTEDRERSRISKDIHDGLQQTLMISYLNFENAKKHLSKVGEVGQAKFKTGLEFLNKGITESRVVAHTLMPKAIVDFGLASACISLVELMNESFENTNFNFIHNTGERRLGSEEIEITLYRIIQEAINNIIKHAKADNVEIQLKNYDDIILLTIEDDGVGFDLKNVQKGLGLSSIQNRLEPINGLFEINSQLKHGTSIVVEINKSNLLC